MARARVVPTGKGSIRTYLLASVHHRAVDAVRREQTQRRRELEETSAPASEYIEGDVADQVADRVEKDERRRCVVAAMGSLPEDQCRVLHMMYFDGKTQRGIAEELGLPLGTVKGRASLAMRKLKASLVPSLWKDAR